MSKCFRPKYRKIQLKVPGKLMLAGEYQAVLPGHKSIVMAVDRYVTITIECQEGPGQSYLRVPQILGEQLIPWQYQEATWRAKLEYAELQHTEQELAELEHAESKLEYVLKALEVVGKACLGGEQIGKNQRLMAETGPYHGYIYNIQIESNLDVVPVRDSASEPLNALAGHSVMVRSVQKVGLGSSAAVTVAVVAGMCLLHEGLPSQDENNLERCPLTTELKDRIYQLAYEAHYTVQGSGSGADVAASVYGGLIASTCQGGIEQLNPRRLPPFAVGYTGFGGKTGGAVARFLGYQQRMPEHFEDFVTGSAHWVERLVSILSMTEVQGPMHFDDWYDFSEAIRENQRLLEELDGPARIGIMVPELKLFSFVSNLPPFCGKVSGAGGGDCGIGFAENPHALKTLIKKWQGIGMTPLALGISENGIHVEAVSPW